MKTADNILISMAANRIEIEANLIYWSAPSADFHKRNMHEEFQKLAKLMGYIIIAKEQDDDNA